MDLRKTALLSVSLFVAVPSLADQPVGPQLPESLRQLLREEMGAVKKASLEILEALVAGEDAKVAQQARGIRDSFILAKRLTPEQNRALGRLPAGFLQIDGDFHATAGKLAQAAEGGDRELQRYYFGRLVEGCQGCHGRYAQDRYPAFGPTTDTKKEDTHAPAEHLHVH